MKDVILAVEKLSLSQFDPKQGTGTFKIHFRKDSEQQTFEKQYALSQPEPIVADILKEIKHRGKMEIQDYDDLIGSIFVVRLLDEDNVDEKLFNFIARLCEKIKTMKHMKSHGEYMKLYDEIKIKELRLT
ncbi:hypothetical protein J4208_01910 [Candidatus Woesearchaeota archaeon]|nr:hypothetical protein [Candidatus Woesearchaeota archaeon]